MPERTTRQPLLLVVPEPDRAEVVVERRRDPAQQRHRSLLEGLPFAKRLGDSVVSVQLALGQPSVGDVLHDSDQAYSLATFLLDLTYDAHLTCFSVGTDDAVSEVDPVVRGLTAKDRRDQGFEPRKVIKVHPFAESRQAWLEGRGLQPVHSGQLARPRPSARTEVQFPAPELAQLLDHLKPARPMRRLVRAHYAAKSSAGRAASTRRHAAKASAVRRLACSKSVGWTRCEFEAGSTMSST
jgi:hypothetical protein